MRLLFSLLLISCFTVSLPGFSQATTDSTSGGVKVIPFPNLGYAPETGFFFGGVALFTWRTADDPDSKPSKVKPEVNYTLKNQFIATLNHDIFLANNKWYFSGFNAYLKYPESYWGIGNDMADDQEEQFTAKNFIFKNQWTRLLHRQVYVGLIYHFHALFDVEKDPLSQLNKAEVTGGDGGISSGAGGVVLHDRRDNLFTPTQGHFLQLSGTSFHPAIGSDFDFVSVEWDVRKYWPLFRKKLFAGQPSVLAFQLYGKAVSAGAPFYQLALLGGDAHMRGYHTGRYRDQNYLAVQAEYRMMVWKFLGFAVFAGAGDVVPQWEDFAWSSVKYSLGSGLRVRVDKKDNINLRFDYGIGVDGNSGFYVMFGEAF